ncbi:YckD family protein [Bacillus sp. DNRA2]|uniref:YckD family protein n=1 Tax=Bacillus sp. DNRA2 TaxID=2723053 RepID=UPI00145EFE77|nr:YckD family protein [Bacillus sp. DNRA2]NMD72113.1 YckD family protein [Bacillus sp. DNRA2]
MRKYLWSALVTLLLSVMLISVAYGQKNDVSKPVQPSQPSQPQVQLNEQQKTELAKLHKDILEKKKEMIQKYVEFGVIEEEKGQMMIAHFEKHYEMMEQNGFMMPHHPMKSPRAEQEPDQDHVHDQD